MNRRDRSLIKKIQKYCGEVIETHQLFHEDKVLFFGKARGFAYRNAIAMPVFQIGELSKALSSEERRQHPDIPWGGIIKMREIFAHHYGDLNYDILWDTSTNDVPALAEKIRRILEDGEQ